MNMKRMRGRGHRPNGGGGGGGFRNQQNGIPLNRNHVFDSTGPEGRVRGTAQQLFEKYTQLARDAASNSDRVLSEAHYQHAEHYFRIIAAINQAQGGEFPRREPTEQGEAGESQPPRESRDQPRDNREQRHERRFDNRPPRPEFVPRERGERPPRPQPAPLAPLAEAPIDISSALEAELAAATGTPPAGFGDQPEIPMELPLSAPEPRAIAIIAAEPPPAAVEDQDAAPVKRPRGRPRKLEVHEPEAPETSLE